MSRNLTGKHILIHIAISLYKKVVVLDEGGKFLKKLWCCLSGRERQGNLVLPK